MPLVSSKPLKTLESTDRLFGFDQDGKNVTFDPADLAGDDGKSAYDIAVDGGFIGTEAEWLEALKGVGKSAYQVAVDNGYVGTEAEWLDYIKGDGLSAYQIAQDNGFTGTEVEWLASLEGDDAYAVAVAEGFGGSKAEWLESLQGDSAYERAVANGFTGTEVEWLESLEGDSAYSVAVDNGFSGTEPQWLSSLKGDSAFKVWQDAGNTGTIDDFLLSLQGKGVHVDEDGPLDETVIQTVETAGVDWLYLVRPNEDNRANQAVPASLNGDMERHLLFYNAGANAWFDYGQFTGIQGQRGLRGPSGVPDEVGVLDAAKIASIEAGGDFLFVVEEDARADRNLPAYLAGDKTRLMLEWTAATSIWTVVGPWIGSEGKAGPNSLPDENGTLDEAKIAAIETAGVDWNFVVEQDERSNKLLPSSIAGDRRRHMVRYDATAQSWASLGPWIGRDGTAAAKGDPGIPNEVTSFDEAKIAQIEANGADWLIVASPDARADRNTPASLIGDKTRLMLKYVAATQTWAVVGQWQGQDGSTLPSYDLAVAHQAGIALGGYPITEYVGVAMKVTKLAARTAAGSATTCNFTVVVNGVVTTTQVATDALQAWDVDIDLNRGDRLSINITGTDAKMLFVTLSR